MKKTLLFLLIIILSTSAVFTFAEKEITLFLDGEKVECDPSPVIVNSRTLIPVRALFEQMGAKVSWNGTSRVATIKHDEITVKLTIDSDVATVDGEKVKLDSPATIIDDRTFVPARFIAEKIGAKVAWDGENYYVKVTSPGKEETPLVIIDSVSFKSKADYDLLTMSSSGKYKVKTMELSDPYRMVFDIQNAMLSELNASYKGKIVTEVRTGGHSDYVRLVVENDYAPRYIFSDNDGLLELRLYDEEGSFNFLASDTKELIFGSKAKISIDSQSSKKLIFNVKGTTLTDETLKINDDLVSSVEVSGKKVTINLNSNASYNIDGNVIKLEETDEPVKDDSIDFEKSGLVVLDAGHGGTDPGSLGYDEDGEEIIAYEKDMNLTITLMVYEILKDEGINVILTRKTDKYLGLLERAEFANEKGAELFVSIHNNSIPDPEYKGSMVLYSLGSTGGKKLASNILKEMTKSAGTENKGLRDGTNMAVIKRTAMPAVIVECGCLTNREELENLMDVDFLYSLAEGIAKGIIKTLNGK